MAQLGKAVSILIRAHMHEHALHADVDAWYAPGECHTAVAKGEGKRLRAARRHALHVAGVRNLRQLRRHVRAVLGNDRFIYHHYGFVPY